MSQTDKDLTARERAFALQYVIDLNGTQAAIRAGYSPTSAAETACEHLKKPHVRAFLARLQERSEAKTLDLATRVRRELEKLAFAEAEADSLHAQQQARCEIDGNTEGKINKLLPTMTAEVEVLRKIRKDIADSKARALELLGKHTKLWTDQVEHKVEVRPLADASLAQILEALEKTK